MNSKDSEFKEYTIKSLCLKKMLETSYFKEMTYVKFSRAI